MGIKSLNKYLMDRCSPNAIRKIHLSELANKTLIIDTSIYLYKFVEKNALLENIYLMISIFRKYNITPIFVFDGKPPSEKMELLEKRKIEKKMAEEKYYLLKKEMEENAHIEPDKKEDLLAELDHLKKKFVRIRESDIQKAKELMQAYGIMFIESHGEADQLCAYLTRNRFAWACVSDDMDMFVFGCQRVLRHISLLNHTAIQYDTNAILNEINIPYRDFKDILVLSGTDYNIGEKTSLYETLKWYNQYIKYSVEKGQYLGFYDWLMKYSKYIYNREKLDKVHSMFDLSLYALHNHEEILKIIHSLPFRTHNIDIDKLQTLMMSDGFIFV